jgi:hypothetical protein
LSQRDPSLAAKIEADRAHDVWQSRAATHDASGGNSASTSASASNTLRAADAVSGGGAASSQARSGVVAPNPTLASGDLA